MNGSHGQGLRTRKNQSAEAAAAAQQKQKQNERTRRVSGDESLWILNLAITVDTQVTMFTYPNFVTAKRLIEYRSDMLNFTFQRSWPTSSDKAHPESCFTSTEGRGVGGN